MGEYSPKISVLMVVYNAEKFIRRSVESVLCQTFRDFELICVDDGSQDVSLDILKEYAKRDHRLKIVANPHQVACEKRLLGGVMSKYTVLRMNRLLRAIVRCCTGIDFSDRDWSKKAMSIMQEAHLFLATRGISKAFSFLSILRNRLCDFLCVV